MAPYIARGYTMKKDKNKEIEIRNRTVVKSNDLIQKSRFSLSLLQQKIVLYLISHITPRDKEFTLYEFSIIEFCRVCGIDSDNGKNYAMLKAAIKGIADKSMWIELEDGEETLVRWIEKPYINKRSGLIKIRLDEDLKPYLLQLKANFTQYELLWTLHFKSKYTIRLYELIKSIHYKDLEPYSTVYTLNSLRRLLDAERYTDYKHFRERVLDVAVKEINQYSDKIVEYKPIKEGKAVTQIEITVTSKDTLKTLKIRSDIEHEYNLNQMTLWDLLEDRGIVSYE